MNQETQHKTINPMGLTIWDMQHYTSILKKANTQQIYLLAKELRTETLNRGLTPQQ